MKGFFNSRKFRQGSMATAITIVVVALIVVINFLATSLTSRYSLKLDLTPNKLFSITDETKGFLTELNKDVKILVLDSEESFAAQNEYYLQAVEVLKKYTLASPHITLEFVDLVADPTFAQNYPALQLTSSSILITSGDRVRDVTPYELLDVQSDDYGNGKVAASKAEQVLTSAILGVTSDKNINVAVITGHNEEDITAFTALLTSNNYLVEDQSILTEELNPSYTVAVIAAPQRDFEESELQRLDRFLKNDGKYGRTLLYFSSSDQTELPNLSAFLADWGIAVEPGMVFETDPARYYPENPFMAVVDFAEETYSANAAAAKLIPFTAYARPVRLLFESKSAITTSTLLQFGATAGIAPDSQEATGSVPYMVMANARAYEGTTPMDSYVIAAGSTALVTDQFLASPNFANSQFTLDLLAAVSGKEDAVQIQAKEIGATTLSITAIQAVVLGLLLAVVFPLAVLIFGTVVWMRRRHR